MTEFPRAHGAGVVRQVASRIACLTSAMATLAALPAIAAAQFPSVPVVESPFFDAGRAGGMNLGLERESTAYVAAGSWVPASERWKVSAGLGYVTVRDGGGGVAAGIRGAYPFRLGQDRDSTSTVGVALFAGAGGFSVDGVTRLSVPAGAAIGVRGAVAGGRAYAVHAAPFLVYNRASGRDDVTGVDRSASGFVIRLGTGADFAVTPRVGLSLALEFGQDPDEDDPGARGTVLGAGVALRF